MTMFCDLEDVFIDSIKTSYDYEKSLVLFEYQIHMKLLTSKGVEMYIEN